VETGGVPVEPALMCYSAKLAKGETKHEKMEAEIADEFGVHTVDVKKEKELCFISTITLP